MKLGRRSILRGLAVAPAAAHTLGEQLKLSASTGVANRLHPGLPSPPSASIPPTAARFTSFADWFKRAGRKDIERNASYVAGLDPDLIEMRLPLQTKYRLQRSRQIERAIEQRKQEFEEMVSAQGYYAWWL